MKGRIKSILTLDLRSIALMRMGIALVLMGDILVRLCNAKAFYTNEGVLPLSVLHTSFFSEYAWSIHAMNGTLFWQIGLLLIAFFAAGCMFVGYHTRWATLISWILLSSIQNRNILILQGGDDLLRLGLFWCLLLPTSRVWSLDSKGTGTQDTNFTSVINLGYLLLLFSVYFFSALMKYSPEWYSEGTALYYALSLEQMTYPLSKLIYNNYTLLKVLTFATIILELVGPFLLFVPYRSSAFKFLFFILFSLLHMGIGLTLQVGYFFIISVVVTLALLPTRVIEKIGHWIQKVRTWGKFEHKLKTKELFTPKQGRYIAVFALAFCLLWNVGNLVPLPNRLRNYIDPIGQLSGLNQDWGMFAPTVYKEDGWYVYKGMHDSAGPINLLSPGQSFSYQKPEWPVYQYPNAKWRKLGENLLHETNTSMRLSFCLYHLFNYNDHNPEKPIHELKIIYLRELSLPHYKTAPIDTLTLCDCKISP